MADWFLNISSREAVGSWEAAAAVLRGLMDAITRPVEWFYGQPLTWLCEPSDGRGWYDPVWIADMLVSRRTRDDHGKVMPTLGSGGTVQGYLGDQTDLNYWMTSALYRVRGEPISVKWDVRFSTRDGLARPLDQHAHEWLISLVATSAAVARAYKAVMYTTPLIDALDDRGASNAVGAVTFTLKDVVVDALPDGLRVYDAPGYPGAQIVIADLGRLEDDPESLVDDLLVLDAALTAAT